MMLQDLYINIFKRAYILKNYFLNIVYNKMENKIYCKRCNKKLLPFRVTNDWSNRDYHKKCYKHYQWEQSAIRSIERTINAPHYSKIYETIVIPFNELKET